jgi:polyvinyl alcohol dehydrogenase (cytochrome)
MVTIANGVVYAGSMDPLGHMYALDAASSSILWSYASGGSVVAGPAVVKGTVYWGSGYARGLGTPNNRLFAFALP